METLNEKSDVAGSAAEERTAAPTLGKKRKWVRRLIILAVIAVVIALLLSRCMKAGTKMMADSYLTSTAEMHDMTVTVTGTGPIQPLHEYRATTLISGEILEAPFEEGQRVEKGDLLFRIDAKDIESNIKQLELNLRSARLTLNDLLSRQKDNHSDFAIRSTASGVITKLYVKEGDMLNPGMPIADIQDRARMKLTVPFHTADAAGFLAGQNAIVSVNGTGETLPASVDSVSMVENVAPGGAVVRDVTLLVANPGALTETSQATATVGGTACAGVGTFRYAASEQVLSKAAGEVASLSVKEGSQVADGQQIGAVEEPDMDTQIESARIQVESIELSLQNARDKLADYSITSTISGTVIEKNVDVGDNVGGASGAANGSASPYMAVIYDLSGLTFDIGVSDLDINKIQVGQKVDITADALNGKTFTGVVDKVNINGAAQGGFTSYPVTVAVDGTPEELKPGMNISADILVEHAGDVLTVPVDAVDRGNEILVAGPGCLDENGNVVDPAAIETREVVLGRNNDDYIEVLSGLNEGETVLIRNKTSNIFTMWG